MFRGCRCGRRCSFWSTTAIFVPFLCVVVFLFPYHGDQSEADAWKRSMCDVICWRYIFEANDVENRDVRMQATYAYPRIREWIVGVETSPQIRTPNGKSISHHIFFLSTQFAMISIIQWPSSPCVLPQWCLSTVVDINFGERESSRESSRERRALSIS